MTGRYDLLLLVTALLEHAGPCEHLRIATLSFHDRNVTELMRQRDAGTVGRLTLLCSTFFRENQPATYERALQELVQVRGGRLAFARNHAKVIALAWPDGRRMALEGSANLRTNSNQEQFCLVNDAGLHDWHASWIDRMVSRNEGRQESTKGRGGRKPAADAE